MDKFSSRSRGIIHHYEAKCQCLQNCDKDNIYKQTASTVDNLNWIAAVCTPNIGWIIWKKFGGQDNRVQVIWGPRQIKSQNSNTAEGWHVNYEDGEKEDLEVEELIPLVCNALEWFIGMVLKKMFEDGQLYPVYIISGPTDVGVIEGVRL